MASVYEDFRRSFTRDGADYSIIDRASGQDLVDLENDLIANLDYYEVPALAHMKSKKALPHLKSALRESCGTMSVFIAQALWEISGFKRAPDICIAVLLDEDGDSSWSSRIHAAYALREFNIEAVNKALRSAMFDENYLVRHHAAMSLANNRGRKLSDERARACLSDGEAAQIEHLADWLDRKRLRF